MAYAPLGPNDPTAHGTEGGALESMMDDDDLGVTKG